MAPKKEPTEASQVSDDAVAAAKALLKEAGYSVSRGSLTEHPEPTEESIRDRNVSAGELAEAEANLVAMKADESASREEVQEAMEIVAILRAAHREGQVDAGVRTHDGGAVVQEG